MRQFTLNLQLHLILTTPVCGVTEERVLYDVLCSKIAETKHTGHCEKKYTSLLQLKCADFGSRSDGLRLGTNQVVINSCPAKKTTGARGKKGCTKLAPDHQTSCTWDNYTQLYHLFNNHFDDHIQVALFLTNCLCHFVLWLFVTIHNIWKLGHLCWNNYAEPCTALKRQAGQYLGMG